jgi:DNA-binding XRE family transcriptional regulator
VCPVQRRADRPLFNCLPQLRAEHSLSRAELADRVEVNVQTIGSLERGDYYPSLDLALRLAEVFERPVEAVFSRTPFLEAGAMPVAAPIDRSR